MSHPDFFDEVPKVSMYDPLAEFLGATEGGILQYGYFDAVRLAGHSCPTVASAYWSTCKALASLYPDTMPVRGAIRVEFRQDSASGVTGVIANVVGMLTGATQETGFKGLAGQFDRRRLLFFGVDMRGELRFTRLDTGRAVYVAANLQHVPGSPRVSELMANCLDHTATPDEITEFHRLWQERVRRILLEYGNDPQVFAVTPA